LYTTLHINFITYWVIVGVSHAAEFYRRYRERERAAALLETQLAQAQLQALKMQIQPHFLFNSLNSIAALIEEDSARAGRMIARLGDFLRLTLANSDTQVSTVTRELEFIKTYLDIEQVRFEDRLRVQFEIDQQAGMANVPSMILQPIVENAIQHGVSQREAVSHIYITVRRDDEVLIMSVKDRGPGRPGANGNGNSNERGLGLANTKMRLQNLYGVNQRMEICNVPGGGLIVTLTIPFVEESRLLANLKTLSEE
jgi:sensor histidine kinase YesM